MKISEEAAVQMPMKTVASLIAMVAIGTWAYFGLHETLNNHSTQLELITKDLELQKEVLNDVKNRLARAEATWDMAENIFQQLADQVRQHEYDIKDLNR